jgi:hypothetical protein
MTTPGLAKFGRPGGLSSSHPADLSWPRWGFRVIRQTHGHYAQVPGTGNFRESANRQSGFVNTTAGNPLSFPEERHMAIDDARFRSGANWGNYILTRPEHARLKKAEGPPKAAPQKRLAGFEAADPLTRVSSFSVNGLL